MKRFAWLVLPAILSACAAGPQLEKYPRAEIDRPYTLPKGVAAWKTAVLVGQLKDTSGSITIPPIPIPLFWDMSLSDDWTLHWAPLPLSVSHQINRTKEQLWGVTFGLGLGYGSDFGGVFAPSALLFHRWKFSDTVALESSPHADAIFYTKNRSSRWAFGLDLGPLFQLAPTFAIKPSVGVRYQRGYDATLIEGSGTLIATTGERLLLPLSFGFTWSAGRQWDIRGEYTYSHIGHLNDFTAHIGTLWFNHYW